MAKFLAEGERGSAAVGVDDLQGVPQRPSYALHHLDLIKIY